MPDAQAVKPIVIAHMNTFQQPIESIGADKAYYSKENEKFLLDLGVKEVALQRINRKYNDPPDNPLPPERWEAFINRRSTIEATIGHLKHCHQMRRSRMKSDRSTESSGFCAMLSFNLHQMMRYLSGAAVRTVA